MRLSTLMTVNAVVAGLFGLAFVVVPVRLLSVYGATGGSSLAYVAQLYGAALLGFALLTWSARNAGDSEARRAIVLALFVADAIGFVIALISQLRIGVNAIGWSTVAIYLLFALGFGYFQFKKPATE